jgi:type IV pilus assembly protein PilV
MNRRITSFSVISQRKKQAGFSLIEVLVSALILSIGLIGVAGLQAVSLKNNQSAYMRSQACALAYDLADRMRANVGGADSGFYDPTSANALSSCKNTTGCGSQQMARNDLSEWLGTIATILPMGSGFVCIDSTPYDGTGVGNPQCDGTGTQFSVKIWWDDNRDGAVTVTAANNERMSINFQL